MRKIIFLLILLFPTFAFGQNYTGNYRAVFFNLFSEPKTIIAEFEVKLDNSIIAKVKVGDEVKPLNGKVDKKGKFEAVSQKEGNTTYKLKGKFDKNNKISFIQRVQVGSGLNKSVSESGFEGTFSKVEKPVEQVEPLKTNPPVELVDNGKSWLKIQPANPMFGNEWKDFSAKIIAMNNGNAPSYKIQINSDSVAGQQTLTLLFPTFGNNKVWKAEHFDMLTYLEKDKKTFARNSFLLTADIYKENPAEFLNTRIEIVKETETQIVFKLANFKIKRVAKDDFVELNGFIYADK